MVKAIKRKTDAQVAPIKKKERTNKVKIMTLVALTLMVLGWTVGSYLGMGANNDRTQPSAPTTPKVVYGVMSFVESMEANINSLTNNHAVFGQLDVPVDLNKRLKGDLYAIDTNLQASSIRMIFTNASVEKINEEAKGEFIVYTVADCGNFNCLLQDQTNGTAFFDVYSLNKTSSFVTTNKIGIPSVAGGITI